MPLLRKHPHSNKRTYSVSVIALLEYMYIVISRGSFSFNYSLKASLQWSSSQSLNYYIIPMRVHSSCKRMTSSSHFAAIARLFVLARKDPVTTSLFSSILDPVTMTWTLLSWPGFKEGEYSPYRLLFTFSVIIVPLLINIKAYGKQGWRSGESTRVPPMWPEFDSRTPRQMWVKFVIGSRPCSERFFSGYSGFPLSSKTKTSKFQFGLESVPN